ncbi:MAG: phage terminase large subunit family protein [Hyphomonadaceae bacterium]|nr:phage terminase large subunit family protein [Hyphomonadaceae bacterium]
MPATLREPETAKRDPGPSLAVLAIDARAVANFAPPPKISTADWIESNVTLPSDVSDTPGLMALFPYQRGIADACDDPAIERVTWQKCARIGATSLMVAIVASFVKNNPSNILAVQPTQDDARDFMVSTVEPVFAASPSLAGLLVQDEKKRDTIQSRRFPGGSFKCVGAAPRNLRRHFVRVLMLDETDGYLPSPEGNPLKLAENRTRTARDRLIFQASTPTDAETSNIARAYRESDQRIYETPCPHCGEHFEPRFEHLKWDKSEDGRHMPETAHLVCPANGCVIEESSKSAMVAAGRWRATAPHVKGHAGFKCSALISTIEHARWANIVGEFLEAKSDPELLRVWTNTLLGDVFADRSGEGLDENALARRAERIGLQAIPEDVRLLTAGVDVQADRLCIVTLGHSATQMFALADETIWGAPTAEQTWRELDDLLKRRFPHPLGGMLGYDAAAIDSGDGNVTDIVYSFTRPRFSGRRVVSIKGDAGNRALIERASKPWLWIVGVDGGKSRLFGLLEQPGHIRFSQDLPPRFYEELCSERRVTFYKSGQPRRRWERIKGMRAEALDAFVYAMAVRGLVGVNLTTRENELRALVKPNAQQTVFRSKWMEGSRGGA